MEKIAKMAKESEEEKNRSERYEEGRKEYFKRAQEMYEDAERKETKEEYFRRLMKRQEKQIGGLQNYGMTPLTINGVNFLSIMTAKSCRKNGKK